MPKIVAVELLGGLGNQLFQACAAMAVADAAEGAPIHYLPAQQNKHSVRDYRPMLEGWKEVADAPYSPGIKVFNERANFAAWDPQDVWKGVSDAIGTVLLRGYFQYLPAIEKQVQRMCERLHVILMHRREAMKAKWLKGNEYKTAFLHIRRGDYLTAPAGLHWILGYNDYYKEAMNYVSAEQHQLLIISDDPEWCRNQAWLSSHTIVKEEDELNTLALMSLCRAGAIIANSTFSWWGATLAQSWTVVAPRQWYAKEKPLLFPPSWILEGEEAGHDRADA